MRRLIGLLVVALLGFYVAWPAWSGYRIANALTNQDEVLLAGKVDFPMIRESLRPVAAAEIGKRVDKEAGSLGPVSAALGGDLKKQMLGKIVDQVLAVVVTPKAVIRIAHDGADVAASVEKAMAETAGQMGNVKGNAPATGGVGGILGQVMGGAGGADLAGMAAKALGGLKKPDQASTPAPAATPTPSTKRSFGLANIKGFRMAGPFGFDVDVARDAAQPKADATVGMSFTGGDWKLTRVVPNL